MFRALEFEIQRQTEVLEAGGALTQETRGWNEQREVTVGQRSKEYAEDYRYFPEPDLPPLHISEQRIEALRAGLPETAAAMRARFVSTYGLSGYDAGVLTQEPGMAALLDETLRLAPSTEPKAAANWLTGEFLRLLGETQIAAVDSKITPELLAGLLKLLADGTITNTIGKTVFEEMFASGRPAGDIVAERNLAQIDDRGQLVEVVRSVLDANPALVDDYRAKDRKTEGPLVGKVMAATGGKANAGVVKELIAQEIRKAGVHE